MPATNITANLEGLPLRDNTVGEIVFQWFFMDTNNEIFNAFIGLNIRNLYLNTCVCIL